MNNLQHLFDNDGQFQDAAVAACLECASTPCFESEFEAFDYLMDEHEPATDAEELREVCDLLADVTEFLDGLAEQCSARLREMGVEA